MSHAINKLIGFREFRLDIRNGQLWHQSDPVTLNPKAFDLLVMLVSRPGEIIKKEVLIEELWPDSDSGANNLTHTVHLLRKALQQYGEEDLIVNIPRRGYRFVGTVSDQETEDAPRAVGTAHTKALESQGSNTPDPPDVGRDGISRRIVFAASAAAGVLIFFFVGLYVWRSQSAIGPHGLRNATSIAVLPFKFIDGDDESLGIRIADSVITRINRLENIMVRPTSAVASITGEDNDLHAVGRRLKVEIIVDGRVQRSGSLLRITSQAVSVATGELLWSDQFSGSPERLLNLQDSISERLAFHLSKSLNGEFAGSLRKQPTENAEAYENYLNGRYFWRKRSHDSIKNAIRLFEKAVELDPDFAAAHVGLADSLFLLYDSAYEIDLKMVNRAKAHIDKAIDLDPGLSEAHSTLGLIRRIYDREIDLAESSFKTALELDPHSPEALNRYGLLLAKYGRFDEAESMLRRALEFDPTSANITKNLGQVLYFKGDYESALQQFRSSLELDPMFAASKWLMARCLWQKGDKDASMQAYADALRGVGSKDIAEMIETELPGGDLDSILLKWIKAWQQFDDEVYSIVILTSHRADKDETIRLLKKAVEDRHPWADKINIEPEYRFLHDDPRFQQLMNAHF